MTPENAPASAGSVQPPERPAPVIPTQAEVDALNVRIARLQDFGRNALLAYLVFDLLDGGFKKERKPPSPFFYKKVSRAVTYIEQHLPQLRAEMALEKLQSTLESVLKKAAAGEKLPDGMAIHIIKRDLPPKGDK